MREVGCNTELTDDDRKRIEEDESIIAVYHGKRGGVVYVHDTVLKTLDADSLQRNVDRMYETANQIIRDYCRRKAVENT